jgi:hypothetical protein
VEIGAVEVHVAAPWRLEGARCVQGAAGSQATCPVSQPRPGHLVRRAGRESVARGGATEAAVLRWVGGRRRVQRRGGSAAGSAAGGVGGGSGGGGGSR